MNPKPMLTHAERLKRRRAIADAVRAGATRQCVAEQFGVSLWTVEAACREFGLARTEALQMIRLRSAVQRVLPMTDGDVRETLAEALRA